MENIRSAIIHDDIFNYFAISGKSKTKIEMIIVIEYEKLTNFLANIMLLCTLNVCLFILRQQPYSIYMILEYLPIETYILIALERYQF